MLAGFVAAASLVAFGVGPTAVGLLSVRLQGPGATMAAVCVVLTLAALTGVAGAFVERAASRRLARYG